ncbi:MAG: nucleoside deaminase [Haloferacaceae archaeon]
MVDDERYVRRTLELARAAGARGDEPFGALLVRGGDSGTAGEGVAGEGASGDRAAGEGTSGERAAGEEASGERAAGEETAPEVIAESENTVHSDGDVTAHPELKLARWAAGALDADALAATTLYTSTEPCAMCAGAVYVAGLGRVVYGVSAARAGDLVGTDRVVPASDVLERGDVDVETVGPVLPEAGARVHEECWPAVDGE